MNIRPIWEISERNNNGNEGGSIRWGKRECDVGKGLLGLFEFPRCDYIITFTRICIERDSRAR